MSIDFTQVKSITIPEGDVKSISLNGTVIWQKPQASPYTVYDDGNHYLCAPLSGEYGNYVDLGITPAANQFFNIKCKFDSQAVLFWNKGYGNAEGGGIACQMQSTGGAGSAITMGIYVGSTEIQKNRTSSTPSTSQWKSNVPMWHMMDTGTQTLTYAVITSDNFTTHTIGGNFNNPDHFKLFSYNNEQTGCGWKFAQVEIITDPNTGTGISCYPAKRNADGVLGMYDVNNDVFYPLICQSGKTDGAQYFWIEDENGTHV